MSELMYEVVIPFGKDKNIAQMCIDQITKKVGPLEMHIRELYPNGQEGQK